MLLATNLGACVLYLLIARCRLRACLLAHCDCVPKTIAPGAGAGNPV